MAREAALHNEHNHPVLVGQFIPECSESGDYQPKQCHASTGYCWCVEKMSGEEIIGTRTRSELDCDQVDKSRTIYSVIESVHGADFWPSEKNDKLTRHAV